MNNFHWLWNYHYGNCWQFNSGLNMSNHKVELKNTYYGYEFGLDLTIKIVDIQNKYVNLDRCFSIGMVVFVHNSSFTPFKTDLVSYIFVKPGDKTFISVKRIFNYKQPYPYSECIDLASYSSDLYDLISSHRTYRQSDCFKLCRQKLYIQYCECNVFNDNLNVNPKVRLCYNSTDFNCFHNHYNTYNRSECAIKSCPLECNSIEYDLSVSSLLYSSSMKDNFTHPSYTTPSLRLLVYYPSLDFTILNESPKTTLLDLFSQIGGTLSIFISLSIFTIFELIEILILIIYSLIFSK